MSSGYVILLKFVPFPPFRSRNTSLRFSQVLLLSFQPVLSSLCIELCFIIKQLHETEVHLSHLTKLSHRMWGQWHKNSEQNTESWKLKFSRRFTPQLLTNQNGPRSLAKDHVTSGLNRDHVTLRALSVLLSLCPFPPPQDPLSPRRKHQS